jgi:hypothetical protein
MVSQPSAYFDKEKRLIYQACCPTDRVGCSLFPSGIASRIGDNVTASVPLLERHVRFLMADLEDQYLSARTPRARRHAAQGGLVTLLLWLGWLGSSECFTLKWSDFDVIEPCDGPAADLPLGCGSVDLCLGPETKSSRAQTVSVPVAYQTLSGYHCGKWFHRARRCSNIWLAYGHCPDLVFTHLAGTPWNSRFYRHEFLYPSLKRQQLGGDAMLCAFDGTPGNTIESKFWSLHCFRRGARSQVSRAGNFGRHHLRKAYKTQVYGHGRWHRRHGSEELVIIYRVWALLEKVQITLYCM